MVVLQPLFEQNDTTDQQANLMRLLVRDLTNSTYGAIQEKAFQVVPRSVGPNNSVDVKSGSFIVPGTESASQGYYFVALENTMNVPMTLKSDSTFSRIDTIAVVVKDSAYPKYPFDDTATIEWVYGIPASIPVAPDLNALGYKNYYSLANIRVPPSPVDTIVVSNITDLRITRASLVGTPIVCTSVTRPANPRNGQVIFELDTKYISVNEGTSISPSWKAYASSGTGNRWYNYTPIFPISGRHNKVYGRYLVIGNTVIGECGFSLGSDGNLAGRISCTLPIPMTSSIDADTKYLGLGRSYDTTAPFVGTFYSGTAEISRADPNKMVNFSAWPQPVWDAYSPFNWSAGDQMRMLFGYEV